MTTATVSSITVKEAVKRAIEFVQTTYRETGDQIADLALEEVQSTDDGDWWHVTVGFFRQKDPRLEPLLQQIQQPLKGLNERYEKTRKYKVVQINRKTGEIRAMTMREV